MLDPPSSGTPFIILPGNSWHFMTRHILSMSFDVASPYVLKSHESFTYVSPDVFSVSHKSLIVNILQEIVRVSFSAPNASQKCGAFLFVRWLVYRQPIVQVSLVQENFLRTTFPCTNLAEFADYRPDSERLEQKNSAGSAFRCTSQTCTSLRRLCQTNPPRRNQPCALFLFG